MRFCHTFLHGKAAWNSAAPAEDVSGAGPEIQNLKEFRTTGKIKLDNLIYLLCLLRPESSQQNMRFEVQVIVLFETWYKTLTSPKATPGAKMLTQETWKDVPKIFLIQNNAYNIRI